MINNKTLVGEIVEMGEKYQDVLISHGMGCLGCPSSRFESLEDACLVHGIEVDGVLNDLKKLEEGDNK